MVDLFPRALQAAREMEVDLVAVTGDLLDAPDWLTERLVGFEYDDTEPWHAAAREDYALLKQLLDDSGLRYTVLPGNHDDESQMWDVFDASDNIFDVAGHRVVRFCDREAEGHMPRRFATERDRWLAMLTDDSGLPQIHLQHYVVTPPLLHGWPHSYAEGDDIARRTIASGKVRLSISGHYHDGTGLIRTHSTTFSTGPAFCIAPFPWRVYDVTDDGVSMTEHQLGREALPRQRCVFLDRDGVINDLASYRTGAELMNLLPGAADAIRRLRDRDYAVVVLTGQSAIGYGYVPASIVHAVNDKMYRLLSEQGAHVDALYYLKGGGKHAVLTQFADDSVTKTDLMRRAAAELDLEPAGAWMAGDRWTDVNAALAGEDVTPILVRTGSGAEAEQSCVAAAPGLHVADDLGGAVDYILATDGA